LKSSPVLIVGFEILHQIFLVRIGGFEMTSHTNKSLYLKWGELILIHSKVWINFDPFLGLDQYTSPGIQYIIMWAKQSNMVG
jgi:hypothetical protein